MMVGEDSFSTLDRLVERSCAEKGAYDALAKWQAVKAAYQGFAGWEAEKQQLESKLQQLGEPPLRYAVYLEPSAIDPEYLVVGYAGTRMEVRCTQEAAIERAQLAPGQLLLLNKEECVVAASTEYLWGETAEVVNVLRGDEEAEVIAITEAFGQQPARIQVRWRERSSVMVTPATTISLQELQRGDIVRIDPNQMQAVGKVRPRLQVKAGSNDGIIVEMSELVASQGVRIGDIVRIDTGLKFVFEKLPSYETNKLTLEEIPDITYDNIGGLETEIEQIYETIEMPYLYKEQFSRYQLTRPRGILLYGPPGCGKTMVAKAVANSLTKNIRNHLLDVERVIVLYQGLEQINEEFVPLLEYQELPFLRTQRQDSSYIAASVLREKMADYLRDANIDLQHLKEELRKVRVILARKEGERGFFLNVKGPELLDKYVGETEQRIRRIFEDARRHSSYYTPVVIFFDEMEAMFRTRGSGRSSDVETTIVPQFLAEIDGVESAENLVIIGASNRQDMIDPAILRPGRLDIKIKIDRPSSESAQHICSMYLLPTIPLDTHGLTFASNPEQPGEIVFSTAYQQMKDTDDATPFRRAVDTIARYLPGGCDLRLARSLHAADLEHLAACSAQATIGEIRDLFKEDENLYKKLRRFKDDLHVKDLVISLRDLDAIYRQEEWMRGQIDYFTEQEWIAETLIHQTVAILYSRSNLILVLTTSGNSYSFPLRDMMSGAILANIVARAKRQALKREVSNRSMERTGLRQDDMLAAIIQEFQENKEQLAQYMLQTHLGKIDGEVQSVELQIATKEEDPWSEEKKVIYI